jgi:drug/metabolite transporter (DMT)-like permease
VLALLLVQVLFATHYIAAKLVLREIPPRSWASIRVGGAALVLLAIVAATRSRLPRGPGLGRRFALFALLGVVINQVCFIEGLKRTTVVNSSLINCTIPVLTLLFALLAGRESADGRRLAALALALTGVLVLLRVETFEFAHPLLAGDLLSLANATSFAAFLVVSKPTLEKVASLPATALLFLLGAPVIGLLASPEIARATPTLPSATVLALGAYIIAGPTVLAYLLNSWALRRAPSSLVALFIYLQPILAALLSVLLLGEEVTVRQVVAFALVAAGVALGVRSSSRASPAPAAPHPA